MKSQEKQSQRDSIILINRGSRDLLINSKLELYIKVSGKEDSEMALENKLGLMVLSTLENGEMMRKKGEEYTHGQMGTFTVETG